MLQERAYQIIKQRHITEKATLLSSLKDRSSNPSLRRCENGKYVFLVHPDANKHEIAQAVEAIYKDRGVRVEKVNTLNVKGKKRRVRGRVGTTSNFKKAIVTLASGQSLENV